MKARHLIHASLREIGATDFGKFALLQSVFAVASMWIGIFVLALAQAPSHSFLIIGVSEVLALSMLGTLTNLHRNRQRIWHLMLIAAIGAWLAAAPAAVFAPGWPLACIMTTGLALLATLKRSVIADTLYQVQSGEKRHVKLAIIYFLTPLLTMLLTMTLGFASQLAVWLGFVLLAALLGLALLRWRGHVPLQAVEKLLSRQNFGRIAPRAKIQLGMGALLNMVDAPLRFVMTPVFIYSYFDGHLDKVGTALGLLSLIVLIASIIRHSLQQHRDLPIFAIMFAGVFCFTGSVIAWGLYYTAPLVVMGLFALRALIAPIWTFGFYAALQRCDPDNFHMNSHLYAFLTSAAHATGFLIMALTGSYAFQASASYILIAGLAETAIVLTGLALWLLAPDRRQIGTAS